MASLAEKPAVFKKRISDEAALPEGTVRKIVASHEIKLTSLRTVNQKTVEKKQAGDSTDQTGEKKTVFGPQGVVFTMKNLTKAYMSALGSNGGMGGIPLTCIEFDTMDSDQSLTLFYQMSEYGEVMVPQCDHIVQSAIYESRDDGLITVQINGISIRQERNGDVEICFRPRHIELSPTKNTVAIRTHSVDMGVQEGLKGFVKSGMKRVHVSKSGMVVSDGNTTTSMDQFGNILSV